MVDPPQNHQANLSKAGRVSIMDFYATFGQGSAFKSLFVEIQAESEEIAHRTMDKHFGRTWCRIYVGETFFPQIKDYGLTRLIGIHAIDHGSSIEFKRM
jgi:hypothetical protein